MKRDTQHNDTRHNGGAFLCYVSFMLSVTCKPHLLSVVKLNVAMLSVVVPLRISARGHVMMMTMGRIPNVSHFIRDAAKEKNILTKQKKIL
jgi:hypothetical protein